MLKTDYQDDMFVGSRKYSMVTNEDKTISLIDMTDYTQEGDQFGANDINSTNAEVNRLQKSIDALLPAAGWSSAAPYEQTITVEGIKATDAPIIECVAEAADKAAKKAFQKAWNMVDKIVTGDGQITATCSFEKPAVDLTIRIKGA